ncbi:MAG: hypothetical protein RJS97_01830 [Parvibaculaceae bacterium]
MELKARAQSDPLLFRSRRHVSSEHARPHTDDKLDTRPWTRIHRATERIHPSSVKSTLLSFSRKAACSSVIHFASSVTGIAFGYLPEKVYRTAPINGPTSFKTILRRLSSLQWQTPKLFKLQGSVI